MSELVEIAILAYRNARYRDAIELLLQVTDTDAGNWMARMYLGMAYEKTGRVADAHRMFKRITSECADEHIRIKAENALPLVEAEMRRRFQKESLPATQKKTGTHNTAYDDLVWLG